ncbi:MAG: DUF4783 domain-containing protein [Saprospiraceae bacterium]
MKLLKNLVLFFGVILAIPSFGQSVNDFVSAIKNEDMATIEMFMMDKVEFCIFEDQQMLHKSAASKKFKTFLSTNKPQTVELIHQGNSKDKASQYKVAKMVTSQGTFRVFIYTVGEIKSGSVKEIRIDKF